MVSFCTWFLKYLRNFWTSLRKRDILSAPFLHILILQHFVHLPGLKKCSEPGYRFSTGLSESPKLDPSASKKQSAGRCVVETHSLLEPQRRAAPRLSRRHVTLRSSILSLPSLPPRPLSLARVLYQITKTAVLCRPVRFRYNRLTGDLCTLD